MNSRTLRGLWRGRGRPRVSDSINVTTPSTLPPPAHSPSLFASLPSSLPPPSLLTLSFSSLPPSLLPLSIPLSFSFLPPSLHPSLPPSFLHTLLPPHLFLIGSQSFCLVKIMSLWKRGWIMTGALWSQTPSQTRSITAMMKGIPLLHHTGENSELEIQSKTNELPLDPLFPPSLSSPSDLHSTLALTLRSSTPPRMSLQPILEAIATPTELHIDPHHTPLVPVWGELDDDNQLLFFHVSRTSFKLACSKSSITFAVLNLPLHLVCMTCTMSYFCIYTFNIFPTLTIYGITKLQLRHAVCDEDCFTFQQMQVL